MNNHPKNTIKMVSPNINVIDFIAVKIFFYLHAYIHTYLYTSTDIKYFAISICIYFKLGNQ